MRRGSRMCKTRAFTLVEVLVAGLLTLILLGMIFWFLIPSLRYSSQNAMRVEGQQQALNALNKAERDLQSTAMGGVSLFPQDPGNPNDPVGVALVPLRDVDNDSRQLWQTSWTLIYWDRGTRKLMRKTELHSSPDPRKPQLMTLTQFRSVCATPNGTEQMLATEVTDFDVLDATPGSGIGLPLTLTVEVERKTAARPTPEKFQLERALTLRNKLY